MKIEQEHPTADIDRIGQTINPKPSALNFGETAVWVTEHTVAIAQVHALLAIARRLERIATELERCTENGFPVDRG